MVNLGFKDKIDDLYIPNGMPTEIVNKMKLLVEPRDVFENGCIQAETNLELPVTHIHHYKNLLSSYGIEYQEVVIDEIDGSYYYVIAPYGSQRGFIGLPQEGTLRQITCNFVELMPDKVKSDIKNNKCKVLLDGLTEGHPFSHQWTDQLHTILDDGNIPRNSVYYLTCNNKFEFDYRNHYGGENLINLVSINYFELNLYDTYSKYFELDKPKQDVVKREKFFMSLNRAERQHRTDLIEFLKKENLVEKGYVSYWPMELYLDTNFVDNDHLVSTSDDLMEDISGVKFYENSYFNIVTETFFYEDSLFISEKIFKPILFKQPFLVYSSPFTLKELHKLGYKTFSKIIDESYDLEKDNLKRRGMIESEIKKLCSLSLDELHDVYLSLSDVYEHNFIHFTELIDRGLDESIYRI